MTYKRSLSTSPIDSSTKFRVCLICGDKAHIINYGALSCLSCKTFFRRHGFHAENAPTCYYKRNCPITIQTRKCCTACRFEKCLTMGMIPELIRKEDLHEKHRSGKKFKQKLVSKEIVLLPQPCLLNLLSVDQSSLTTENWKLLSNVVQAFDTYNSISATRKIVHLINIDYEYIQPNIEISLNIMAFIFSSLESLINSIADFRIMTSTEQCSLVQRNMQGLLAFYCILVFRESGIFDNSKTENAVMPLYGYQNVQSTKYISIRLEQDSTLVKIMLIVLAFSSNYFMINKEDIGNRDGFLYGTFRLFGSQNVYAEILWKYMMYRYGFWDAVRRFSGMIKIALDALRLTSNVYTSNEVHRNFAEDISEQFEQKLVLNVDEHTPLWGKD